MGRETPISGSWFRGPCLPGPDCLFARLSWADWDGPAAHVGFSAWGFTDTTTGDPLRPGILFFWFLLSIGQEL